MYESDYITSEAGLDYLYIRKKDSYIDPDVFQIHSHKFYEAVIFLKGDASFAVEGSIFPISPMDVLITRPDEMHQIYHHSSGEYERIMFALTDEFFVDNNCIKYKDVFIQRELGTSNILHLEEDKRAEILNIASRIERYLTDDDDNHTVIRSAIIEFLYELNRMTPSKPANVHKHKLVSRATSYINQNLSVDLSLDNLSKELYTSKTYLCKVFKENTGITIGNYITKKRFLKATALIKDGHSISEAARLSGFSDYSSFYKICVYETGQSPRKALKS